MRVRRSRSESQAIIEETLMANASVAQVARRHGFERLLEGCGPLLYMLKKSSRISVRSRELGSLWRGRTSEVFYGVANNE